MGKRRGWESEKDNMGKSEGESRDSGDRLPTRNKTSMPKAIWGNANVGWIHNPSINVVGGIYGIRIVFI